MPSMPSYIHQVLFFGFMTIGLLSVGAASGEEPAADPHVEIPPFADSQLQKPLFQTAEKPEVPPGGNPPSQHDDIPNFEYGAVETPTFFPPNGDLGPGFGGPQECQDCANYGGIIAGVDWMWLKPRLDDDPAFRRRDFGVTTSIEAVNFERDFDFSARIWLGLQTYEGLGIRGRYWWFDDHVSAGETVAGTMLSNITSSPSGPGMTNLADFFDNTAGNRVAAAADLDIDVFDIEGFLSRTVACHNHITAALGVRYVDLDQRYRIQSGMPAPNPLAGGTLHNQMKLNGWGPTLGVNLVRDLGPAGLGVYLDLRGSVIVADREIRTDQFSTIGIHRVAARSNDEKIFTIGEVGFGVQYRGDLTEGLGVLVRGGYEIQSWSDVGGPVVADGDLGFHGGLLTLGLQR